MVKKIQNREHLRNSEDELPISQIYNKTYFIGLTLSIMNIIIECL